MSATAWAPIQSVPSVTDHAPSLGYRLAALEPGTRVRLIDGGRESDVTVQRWHRDGSMDHARLTVGYGPGRWNVEVTAAQILGGYTSLYVEVDA